jgi:ribosome recycling factor
MSSFELKKIELELEKTISFLQKTFNQVRASRATPALVENLPVNLSGVETPLKQLASISCPQSNQIMIQPWVGDYLGPIEKAISQSNLSLNPIVDQQVIRITLPTLSTERREDLSSLIKEKAEEARQTIRHWWDEGWSQIQDDFKKKEISEDEKFKFKDDFHKLIQDYQQKIEDLKEKKIQEIKEG